MVLKKLSVSDIVIQITAISEFRYDGLRASRALARHKEEALNNDKEDWAAQIWCLEQAVLAQNSYVSAFSLVKKNRFYEAWCEFEIAEKVLLSIEPPRDYLPNYWDGIWRSGRFEFIKRQVTKWQQLYPYKWFSSVGMTYREYCSICDSEISPRNQCEHEDGKIYRGEMRARMLRDIRYDHIALVEKPAHKFCVVFPVDPETNEKVDHYDYGLVKGLSASLYDPFQEWDFTIQQVERENNYFMERGLTPEDLCPCASGKAYRDCCFNSTVPTPFYHFICTSP